MWKRPRVGVRSCVLACGCHFTAPRSAPLNLSEPEFPAFVKSQPPSSVPTAPRPPSSPFCEPGGPACPVPGAPTGGEAVGSPRQLTSLPGSWGPEAGPWVPVRPDGPGCVGALGAHGQPRYTHTCGLLRGRARLVSAVRKPLQPEARLRKGRPWGARAGVSPGRSAPCVAQQGGQPRGMEIHVLRRARRGAPPPCRGHPREVLRHQGESEFGSTPGTVHTFCQPQWQCLFPVPRPLRRSFLSRHLPEKQLQKVPRPSRPLFLPLRPAPGFRRAARGPATAT